jgi:hypothetical protein
MRAALAVLLAVVAMPALADEATKPRIHVFTRGTTGGFLDKDSHKRDEILSELKAKLAAKPTLSVVEDKESADVLVEVIGQEHYRSETTVKLTVGDYSTEITKKSRGLVGGGGIGATGWVAGQIANAVETWVKDNRDKLTARRSALGQD